MSKNKTVSVWQDAETLSVAAAHFFVAACQRNIATKGNFVVALSGGSTPKRLYQLLASAAFSKNIEWDKVFLFWSDERFVATTDPDSNYRMAKENLLDHIIIPSKNIFVTPIEESAKQSASDYEKAMLAFFNNKEPLFDWILLGTGDDGHTASIFPGTEIIHEKKKYIAEVWVEKKQTWRISFTLPLINKAVEIIFLVAGKEKAPVVKHILAEETPLFPAQMVDPTNGTIFWMLDESAIGT